jgi:hypothetical protein
MTFPELFCSYELAKQIYDLGFRRGSVFNYITHGQNNIGIVEGIPECSIGMRDGSSLRIRNKELVVAGLGLIPAYTASELFDILLKICRPISLTHTGNTSIVNYLAGQVIWNIENKLIEV